VAALADRARPGISRGLTFVLALTSGATVANLYYGQPLLDEIGRTFHLTSGLGLVTTATQAGFAAGLLLVVPLGDLLDRRRLVPGVVAASALLLAAAAAAPSYGALLVALVAVGVAGVVGQILVPMAATIAADAERGRVVGAVMSGLLAGILLARVVSGLIASVAGWRAVYWCAAGFMVVLAAGLARGLPDVPPGTARQGYFALLRSIGAIARAEPLVVRRGIYGGLGFAAFSAFWASAALVLAGPRYGYGEAVIGLFSLFGLAGMLMANLSGRLADQGRTRPARLAMFLVLLGSFGLLALGETSIAAFIAGIVLMDLAVQGAHILNQSEIYTRRPEARSRVTSVYMTLYFVGGAVGSALSAVLWDAGGWVAVCALGAAAAVVALLLWATEPRGQHMS
jgi:predicted MFS family arabinose efflux permease